MDEWPLAPRHIPRLRESPERSGQGFWKKRMGRGDGRTSAEGMEPRGGGRKQRTYGEATSRGWIRMLIREWELELSSPLVHIYRRPPVLFRPRGFSSTRPLLLTRAFLTRDTTLCKDAPLGIPWHVHCVIIHSAGVLTVLPFELPPPISPVRYVTWARIS
jgi:hypothetical protein